MDLMVSGLEVNMSIHIHNISKKYSRKGVQQYQLCLNNIILCEFKHLSELGMPELLKVAAEHLTKVDIDSKIREYKLVAWTTVMNNLGRE